MICLISCSSHVGICSAPTIVNDCERLVQIYFAIIYTSTGISITWIRGRNWSIWWHTQCSFVENIHYPVRMGLKNLSLIITIAAICHHSASLVMPNRDRFFNPSLTLMIDSRSSVKSGYRKIIFKLLNQIICCGYSKEPSQWDNSFEHPKHMLKLMGRKIFTILYSKILLI